MADLQELQRSVACGGGAVGDDGLQSLGEFFKQVGGHPGEQVFPVAEVAAEGGAAHVGTLGDVFHGQRAPLMDTAAYRPATQG